MLLHLALVEAGVLLQALRRAGSEEGAERFAQRAWGHLLAFALVAPFCLGQIWPQWGEYSANVLSRFQPWLFALLAAHAALSAAFCACVRGGGGSADPPAAGAAPPSTAFTLT